MNVLEEGFLMRSVEKKRWHVNEIFGGDIENGGCCGWTMLQIGYWLPWLNSQIGVLFDFLPTSLIGTPNFHNITPRPPNIPIQLPTPLFIKLTDCPVSWVSLDFLFSYKVPYTSQPVSEYSEHGHEEGEHHKRVLGVAFKFLHETGKAQQAGYLEQVNQCALKQSRDNRHMKKHHMITGHENRYSPDTTHKVTRQYLHETGLVFCSEKKNLD